MFRVVTDGVSTINLLFHVKTNMTGKCSTKTFVSWHRLIRESILSNITDGGKAGTSVWHTGKDWADRIYPWTEGKFRYLFVLLMLNLQTE